MSTSNTNAVTYTNYNTLAMPACLTLHHAYGKLQSNIWYRVVDQGYDWYLLANGYYVANDAVNRISYTPRVGLAGPPAADQHPITKQARKNPTIGTAITAA